MKAIGLWSEGGLVVKAYLRAAHGQRAAGAANRGLMLGARRLNIVVSAAIFHDHVRLDLVPALDRLGDLHRPQAVERERLVGRNQAGYRRSRAGAELRSLVKFHAGLGRLPGCILGGANLHETLHLSHRDLHDLHIGIGRSGGHGSGVRRGRTSSCPQSQSE